MKFPTRYIQKLAQFGLAAAALLASIASYALNIPNAPLNVQSTAKPLIMLTLGRDHRLFLEAYNDFSDIDGDGRIDYRFKPSITYLGLFNSDYCYKHNNSSTNAGLFSPVDRATSSTHATPRACIAAQGGNNWSGNWLNYITTSRIDAIRVVLYGGMREVDTATTRTTPAETILRRAYIPQDGHSWAKEYTSLAVDGYDISDYTPISQPTVGRRHFFGNVTMLNTADGCTDLNNCSDKPPWLSVVQNANNRVWNWASADFRALTDDATLLGNGTRTNYTVRVSACNAGFRDSCKAYGAGATASFKPVGILHDYGDNDTALFGLITGSYDDNMQGGRLRKVVSSFQNEVDQSNGTFKSTATIVKAINSLRIYEFGRSKGFDYGPKIRGRLPGNGDAPDWGNPIGEIMYEAVRYLSNATTPTTQFNGKGITKDNAVGLPNPAFNQPYRAATSTDATKAPWCARASMLVLSDVNTYDSDALPGANWASGVSSSLRGESIIDGVASNLDVKAVVNRIGTPENVRGLKLVGQVGTNDDNAPTAKQVDNLGDVRGISLEEPNKEGSYYAAAVSYFAKINDLQPSLRGQQTIDTFAVALAAPGFRIEVPVNGNKVTIVPFSKVIGAIRYNRRGNRVVGANWSAQGNLSQTGNNVIDVYVEQLVNDGSGPVDRSINGGKYQASFLVNFDDIDIGGEYDMDATYRYTVRVTNTNNVEVTVARTYVGTDGILNTGYTISGTTNDGLFLVAQTYDEELAFYLNVPNGERPGFCASNPGGKRRCRQLPESDTREFTPSRTASAEIPKNPLWYAAKWGGFLDANANGAPDLPGEWDTNGDGDPDNYFLVQNATTLPSALATAFNSILSKTRTGGTGGSATNTQEGLQTGSLIFRTYYTPGDWSGDITAHAVDRTTLITNDTPTWSASAALPAWNRRNLSMRTSAGTTIPLTTTFASLSAADQAFFGNQNVLDFIRGDQSNSVDRGGVLRNRRSGLLGDFIHSTPAINPDEDSIYIGSNGGMLHAFSTVDGKERFGFIPREVGPKLRDLSSPNYAHDYFVDGYVSLGVRVQANNYTPYLYTLLGRGGKGLFSGRAQGNNYTDLWEHTPGANISTTVVTIFGAGRAGANIATGATGTDPDLGLMLSRPTFAVMNGSVSGTTTGTSALLVGNGFNSTSGKAVLYIYLMNPDGTLNRIVKLDTGVGGDNGLSGPAFADVLKTDPATGRRVTGSDGVADFIYAGDRKGNLWKFDVSSNDPSFWKVALAGSPLFMAKNAANQAQPITGPVNAIYNNDPTAPNSGKVFIFFGTGQYIATTDAGVTQTQSIYGIIDSGSQITDRTSLTQRTFGDTAGTVPGNASGTYSIRTLSKAVANDMQGKNGWFIDLGDPVVGERVNARAQIIDLAIPVLVIPSFYPFVDPCTPGGSGYINYLDPWTGARLQRSGSDFDLIDTNRDGAFNANDRFRGKAISSINRNIGIPAAPLFVPVSANSRIDTSPESIVGVFRQASNIADDVIAAIEANKLYDGNAGIFTKKPISELPCLKGFISDTPGTGGAVGDKLPPCPSDRIRGRVSWREVIRD